MRLAAILCAAALVACDGAPAPPAPRGKPKAPVATWIATRDLGAGLHEVTLVAVPAVQVPSLELELKVPHGAVALGATRARLGVTPAGGPRALTVTVRLDAAGVDLAGAARVPVRAHVRARAAVARLGAPAPYVPPPATREIVLPSGDVVSEVRP